MNILAIGDVVGRAGRESIEKQLKQLKREKKADLCIVNGENIAGGNGIRRSDYDFLIENGADVITTGNHVWGNREIIDMFDDQLSIVRPANYPPTVYGTGSLVADMGRYRVGVVNLMGRVGLEPLDCPFRIGEQIVNELKKECRIIIVDFHAEATSEKAALANYLDGSVSVLFGTHTHVQTADERILPKGTGFLTDIGMTGAIDSVLGMEVSTAIDRFVNRMNHRYTEATGPSELRGALFTVDPATGKTTNIERIVR